MGECWRIDLPRGDHDWADLFISSRAQPNTQSVLSSSNWKPEPHIAKILARTQRTLILSVLYLLVCSSL